MVRPLNANCCKRCGQKHSEASTSQMCCLYAPDPTGWCAWCGEEGLESRVFCGSPCSKSFQEDSFMTNLAPVKAKVRGSKPQTVSSILTGGT